MSNVKLSELQEAERAPVIADLVEAVAPNKFLVRAIVSGRSHNRRVWPEDILKANLQKFEGRPVVVKDDITHSIAKGRDIRNVIGSLEKPHWNEKEKSVDATLHVINNPSGMHTAMIEACKAGRPELIGFSINARGPAHIAMHDDGKPAIIVEGIKEVESLDMVLRPSAGGKLLSLTEAIAEIPLIAKVVKRKGTKMQSRMIEVIKERLGDQRLVEALPAAEDETYEAKLLELYNEAVQEAKPEEKANEAEAGLSADKFKEVVQLTEARANARGMIAGSDLPTAVKSRLTDEWLVEADYGALLKVAEKIEAEQAHMVKLGVGPVLPLALLPSSLSHKARSM